MGCQLAENEILTVSLNKHYLTITQENDTKVIAA
jgi:hypothetical protein